MRDPNRLDNIYEEIKELHKEYFPDIRIGQLFSYFFSWIKQEKGIEDIYYIEDIKLLRYFKEYCVSSKIGLYKIETIFEPVEDKPGYYWFNKENYQMISKEVLERVIKEYEDSYKLLLHD